MQLRAMALLAGPALMFGGSAIAQTTTALPAELAQPATPAGQMLAQADAAAPTAAGTAAQGYQEGVSGYFANWFARSDAAKASQPHWMTPLVTVTPRLEQEVRYDQYWQRTGTGATIDQYDAGKGLELIPTDTNEVLLNPPAFLDRSVKKPAQGYADWGFLTVKQRLASANEQDGNYVLTAFLAAQAPIGIPAYTSNAYVVTPTLGGGKGFGDFVIQATSGLAVPSDHESLLGTAWTTNVSFQYRIAELFWPEVEVNWTRWLDGAQRGGKNQVFLTVGAVVGTVRLTDRLGVALGAGYQFAVAPEQELKPALTPTYKNNVVFSARMPF